MKSYIVLWVIMTGALSIFIAPVLGSIIELFLYLSLNSVTVKSFSLIPSGNYLDVLCTYYISLTTGKEDPLAFILAIVFVGASLAFMMLWAYAKKEKPVAENSILGNSQIIESAKLRSRMNDAWDGQGTPASSGLVYGFENGHYFYDSKTPHQMVVARTGGGKSRFSMLETVHLSLEAGCNLIISDLKNEIIELTGQRAAEVSNVVLYDLENPLNGNRYNPLDLMVNYAEANDTANMQLAADKLASNLVPTEDKNPFFSNAARGLLAACFIAVATADIARSKKNMASVCAMIDEGTTGEGKDPSAALKDFFRNLGFNHPAFSSASEFLSDGGTTAGKNVLSTVKVALRPFTSPAIRWMTAESDPCLDDLITKRTTLYIHVLGKEHPANCLLGCFFSQWWQRVQEIGNENGGAIPTKANLILDEFGSFPKIPLASIVNLGRSYGVSWYGYLQSTTQLALYNRPNDGGAGSKEILANIGIKVALSLSEKADRDYFTELVGKRGVMTRGTSAQKSGQNSSYSNSASERADDLIHPWEWLNFSPDVDGAIVVKAKETGISNRSGVFRMPLVDATKTPAKEYFGLGSREHEKQKRLVYQAMLSDKASKEDINDVDVWHIDFDSCMSQERTKEAIEEDEFSAWEMEY